VLHATKGHGVGVSMVAGVRSKRYLCFVLP
jgi:hypothetical protein